MTKQKFKTGDVVFLESGSPLMAVVCVKDGFVTTVWWEKAGDVWGSRPSTEKFPEEVLRGGVWLPPPENGDHPDGS